MHPIGQDAKGPAASGALRDAVAAAEAWSRNCPRSAASGWRRGSASEPQVPSACALARVPRRRWRSASGRTSGRLMSISSTAKSELANGELEKLALYRPEGEISRADVEERSRRRSRAPRGHSWTPSPLARPEIGGRDRERLLSGGTPMPVLVGQIHRRLRDLILVREHLDAGARNAGLVKAMKMQPFRVQKLSEQAGMWHADALVSALGGLVESTCAARASA